MGKRRGNKEGKTKKDVEMDGGAEKEKEWNYGAAGAPMDGTDGASASASTAGGDGTASKSIGKFGVVLGGVKKRKQGLTFKQKRRKNTKILRATERSERETQGDKSKGANRERKNSLKKLW